jgi:hypothetical protein
MKKNDINKKRTKIGNKIKWNKILLGQNKKNAKVKKIATTRIRTKLNKKN